MHLKSGLPNMSVTALVPTLLGSRFRQLEAVKDSRREDKMTSPGSKVVHVILISIDSSTQPSTTGAPISLCTNTDCYGPSRK